jgi:branched-subunit amino acid transport protein
MPRRAVHGREAGPGGGADPRHRVAPRRCGRVLVTAPMWAAVLPPASNPLMDDHLVYAGVLISNPVRSRTMRTRPQYSAPRSILLALLAEVVLLRQVVRIEELANVDDQVAVLVALLRGVAGYLRHRNALQCTLVGQAVMAVHVPVLGVACHRPSPARSTISSNVAPSRQSLINAKRSAARSHPGRASFPAARRTPSHRGLRDRNPHPAQPQEADGTDAARSPSRFLPGLPQRAGLQKTLAGQAASEQIRARPITGADNRRTWSLPV